MRVRGTGGTEDEEAPVMNTGYGFNVGQNYNTEVMLVSLNSDTNQKYALPTIPRDKQRQWPVNSGGIQHPTNREKFVELNDGEIWLRDGTFVLGNDRDVTLTISNGNLTISCNGTVNIVSAELQHNGINIGDDHVHGGVDTGPSTTQGPQ